MLTLGQASKQIGVSKPTLSKAISSGKLSATRREDMSFAIDPAELQRYFESNKHRLHTAPVEPSRVETLDIELVEVRARADLAEARLADLKVALEELRSERNAWRDQASRLAIPAPVADSNPAPPRTWWRWRAA